MNINNHANNTAASSSVQHEQCSTEAACSSSSQSATAVVGLETLRLQQALQEREVHLRSALQEMQTPKRMYQLINVLNQQIKLANSETLRASAQTKVHEELDNLQKMYVGIPKYVRNKLNPTIENKTVRVITTKDEIAKKLKKCQWLRYLSENMGDPDSVSLLWEAKEVLESVINDTKCDRDRLILAEYWLADALQHLSWGQDGMGKASLLNQAQSLLENIILKEPKYVPSYALLSKILRKKAKFLAETPDERLNMLMRAKKFNAKYQSGNLAKHINNNLKIEYEISLCKPAEEAAKSLNELLPELIKLYNSGENLLGNRCSYIPALALRVCLALGKLNLASKIIWTHEGRRVGQRREAWMKAKAEVVLTYPNSGLFESCLRTMEQAVALNPRSSRALTVIGRYLTLSMKNDNDLKSSEEYLRKAVMIQPNSVEASRQLANTLFMQGTKESLEEAVKILKESLVWQNRPKMHFCQLGEALFALGNKTESMEQKAILFKKAEESLRAGLNMEESLSCGTLKQTHQKYQLSVPFFTMRMVQVLIVRATQFNTEDKEALFNEAWSTLSPVLDMISKANKAKSAIYLPIDVDVADALFMAGDICMERSRFFEGHDRRVLLRKAQSYYKESCKKRENSNVKNRLVKLKAELKEVSPPSIIDRLRSTAASSSGTFRALNGVDDDMFEL